MDRNRRYRHRLGFACWFGALLLALCAQVPVARADQANPSKALPNVAVGAQYDTTHVYVVTGSIDTFVRSFIATFGGKASPQQQANVLPVPSKTKMQYVWTPVGTLSVFEFLTPLPYPFGAERNGFMVKDMNEAIRAARAAGAAVIVEPFKDPVGLDAVIQWPGGVNMQLYWHFKAPEYGPLERVPENRVYLSRDNAEAFVRDYTRFAHGKVIEDDKNADGADIGRDGGSYRRILIDAAFGKTLVLVTDGHLPHPFGREITGYEVADLDDTLGKARAAGVTVLAPVHDSAGRRSAIVQFPGGYIAEIHANKAR